MPDGAKFCPGCGTKAESYSIDDMSSPADSGPSPELSVPDPIEYIPEPNNPEPNQEYAGEGPGASSPNPEEFNAGPGSTPSWGAPPPGPGYGGPAYRDPAYKEPSSGDNGDTMIVILKILAGVAGLILFFVGISQVLTALRWSFNYFRYNMMYSNFGQILIFLLFRLVHIATALCAIASGLLLLLHVLRFEKKYASSSMTVVTAACGLTAALAIFYYFVMLLIDSIIYQYGFYMQSPAFGILIPSLVAIGGFYIVIQQMGLTPFKQGVPFGTALSMSIEDMKAMASSINVSMPSGAKSAGPAAGYTPPAGQPGPGGQPDPGSYSSVNTGAEIPGGTPYGGAPYGGGPGTRADGSPVPYQPPVSAGPAGTPPAGPAMLTTDRSLVKYILLNLVTCGIYSFFFIHGIAQDINTACEGDGKTTSGLLTYVLLTVCTCGIYGLYWWYALGNRIAENGPRYGLHIQENGTTYLMWQIFGVLICGIGPFIATHIICKNLNSLCYAYNQANRVY